MDSECIIASKLFPKVFLFCSAASKPNGPGWEDARAAVRRPQPLLPAAARASSRARAPAGRLLPWPRLRSAWASEISDGDAEPNSWYGQHAVWATGKMHSGKMVDPKDHNLARKTNIYAKGLAKLDPGRVSVVFKASLEHSSVYLAQAWKHPSGSESLCVLYCVVIFSYLSEI